MEEDCCTRTYSESLHKNIFGKSLRGRTDQENRLGEETDTEKPRSVNTEHTLETLACTKGCNVRRVLWEAQRKVSPA